MASKKTVIVTGGSQGIGAGLVKAFVERELSKLPKGNSERSTRW